MNSVFRGLYLTVRVYKFKSRLSINVSNNSLHLGGYSTWYIKKKKRLQLSAVHL